MFYAAINRYGSATSVGFSNTWIVLVFEDRASRDAWLDAKYNDMSARAIRRSEVTGYVSQTPVPFSGEYYCIIPMDDMYSSLASDAVDRPGIVNSYLNETEPFPGLIGDIGVADLSNGDNYVPFYRRAPRGLAKAVQAYYRVA